MKSHFQTTKLTTLADYKTYKKSLKIAKGKSESVNRRTDNTMAKRKSTIGQTTIYKTYTRKLTTFLLP